GLAGPGRAALGGYLGVRVSADERGRLVVADVQADSPGARAGLQVGDVVGQVDGQPAVKVDVLRELLQARAPGEAVKLGVVRGDKPMELTATLAASSRPMKLGGQPVTFGATVGEAQEGTGAPGERVAPNPPADKAGVKMGDVILKVEGNPLTGAAGLSDTLSAKKPGDTLAVVLRRDGKDVELKVELTSERGPETRFGPRDSAPPPPWKKDVFRLAVVAVEFPDTKHNTK